MPAGRENSNQRNIPHLECWPLQKEGGAILVEVREPKAGSLPPPKCSVREPEAPCALGCRLRDQLVMFRGNMTWDQHERLVFPILQTVPGVEPTVSMRGTGGKCQKTGGSQEPSARTAPSSVGWLLAHILHWLPELPRGAKLQALQWVKCLLPAFPSFLGPPLK